MSGAEIVAGLDLGFSLGDAQKMLHDELGMFKERAKPNRKRLVGASDISLGGANVPTICQVQADGPASGYTWDLRNICILGIDDHTVGAFPGAVYVGQASGLSNADFGISDVVDTIPQVPFSETFSAGEVTIPFGDKLFVVLYGVTVGVAFTVTARVDEWRTSDVTAGRI
jgi:hypothetical protein